MRDFIQDLRYGARRLRRSPVFTLMVVLSLAMGIGANAAIFSLLNAFFLRELPVRDPAGLILFQPGLFSGRFDGSVHGRGGLHAHPFFERLRRGNPAFQELAAEDSLRTGVVVRGTGPVDQESGNFAFRRLVTGNYFAVLGVPAHRGRTFIPAEDDRAGADPVVVLSHEYWQRRFAGDGAWIGRRVALNGRQHTIIGVTPPGFVGLDIGTNTDMWAPLAAMTDEFMSDRTLLTSRDTLWLNILGRLRPGVSMAAAETSVNLAFQQFLAEQPPSARDLAARQPAKVVLQSGAGAAGASGTRRGFRQPLVVLMGGAGLLLLIVCLNVSHLLLARASQRRREMSIRTALGASRARIVRQLLTEGLLLAALGTGLGVLIRRWLGDALIALATSGQPGYQPLVLDMRADGRVLAFTLILALATALVLGLAPAWQAAGTQPQQALRSTSQAVAGGGKRLVSRVLLASQVAFSVVLLVAAGLLLGSLGRLRSADRGIDDEHVLLVRISTEFAGMSQPQSLVLQDDILRRVSALPGVRAASLSFGADMPGGGPSGRILLPGEDNPLPVGVATVSPGYFDSFGVPLLRGRDFAREDGPNAPRVAVVNETLARRLSGGLDAVGKRFRFHEASGPSEVVQVVGVLKEIPLNRWQRQPSPLAYIPAAQSPNFVGALQVRTFGDPALLAEQVRRAVLEVNPNLPVRNVRTVRAEIDRSLMRERFMSTLASAFGLAALLLVCLGLYGVISQWVAQRTREIGVRVALGATGGAVRWMVLRQALLLVAVGVLVGIPAAAAAAQLLRRFLYGTTPSDPATMILVALIMFAVASAAAYLPARRASRVDPMIALRSE